MAESSEDINQYLSFRHSDECTSIWHGQSLAGCLKVRWTDGKHSWYAPCCKGKIVSDSEVGERNMSDRNRLTSEWRRFISIALVGASTEIVEIVRIIERLSGEEITPADENTYRRGKNS